MIKIHDDMKEEVKNLYLKKIKEITNYFIKEVNQNELLSNGTKSFLRVFIFKSKIPAI